MVNDRRNCAKRFETLSAGLNHLMSSHCLAQKARPNGKPNIGWNFTKFLIDGDGNVLERFEPQVTPEEIANTLNTIL